jgi:uncharacterized cupredoxin-like copper-binding protein
MPSTTTTDRSTNGMPSELEVPDVIHAPGVAGRRDGPPGSGKDSRASFALFASFIAVLLSLAALIAVAFKLDDNQGNVTAAPAGVPAAAPTAPAGTVAAAGNVQVGMGDYFFQPQDATAAAGKVKISAVNDGKLPHELVLAKTNADPSQLPTNPNGSVNEEKLNSPGEIPDVAAGKTKRGTINLAPGRYVMFCNLPGHYAQGMYGTLTVK